MNRDLRFPLIKLAKKLKDFNKNNCNSQRSKFPLIKLAKKLKEEALKKSAQTLVFPLIKLAKKLKEGTVLNPKCLVRPVSIN